MVDVVGLIKKKKKKVCKAIDWLTIDSIELKHVELNYSYFTWGFGISLRKIFNLDHFYGFDCNKHSILKFSPL